MKNILIILSVFLFAGCTQIMDTNSDSTLGKQFSNIELYRGDFSEISDLIFISRWMRQRATYEQTERIKSPREILESGKCDCDGFALLYMNIMYVRFGIKTSICPVLDNRAIVNGGAVNHAVVKVGNKYIDAQSGQYYTGIIGYEYSFDQVFKY